MPMSCAQEYILQKVLTDVPTLTTLHIGKEIPKLPASPLLLLLVCPVRKVENLTNEELAQDFVSHEEGTAGV